MDTVTPQALDATAPTGSKDKPQVPGNHRTLYVCGLNHERADLAARERFAMNAEDCARALKLIRNEALADEALALSTCNRTEFYVFAEPSDAIVDRLRSVFLSLAEPPPPGDDPPPLYEYVGLQAERHFFEVTAGLDSLILGENEVKRQIGQAYELSRANEMAGTHLHRLVEWSNRCAKRIKTETELNAGTLCYGRASVLRAEQVLGSLEGKVCVVIGAGKIGRAAAVSISERRPARLIIVNRTPENARELCSGLNAEVASISQMASIIPRADLIIGAAFAPHFLVTREVFQAVLGQRPNDRKVCLIDAAVPRILDSSIAEIPGVELLDLDDLEEIIARHRAQRLSAAREARKIVEGEIAKYQSEIHRSGLGVWIGRLREKFEHIFDEEHDEGHEELPEATQRKLRHGRHRLKQRLLHEAIQTMKALHKDERDE